MYTSKILAVTVGVLVFAAGVPLADVTDSSAGKESVTPQEPNDKPSEKRDAQDEDSNALNEALKRWSEARKSLLNAYGEEPPNEHADYATLTSKYESLFKEFDSDGDGGLSMEELGSAVEKDWTDKQKSLSPEGLRAQLEDLHSVADRDLDGSFTLDELTDFFIKAAEELNELHDKRFPDKPNEQPASDLSETEDNDHSN